MNSKPKHARAAAEPPRKEKLMDINNYSLVNTDGKSETLAHYENDSLWIDLEYIENPLFQESFYTVSDLLSATFKEFDDLESAKAFYNTLVPKSARIA